MNPARFFTIASLSFGVALMIATPPFCAPDEPSHLYRAWSTSLGHFDVHAGDAVPRSFISTADAMLRMTRGADTGRVTLAKLRGLSAVPLRASDTVFVTIPPEPVREPLGYNAPSYTPVGYAGTAVAMIAGRFLRLSALVLVYAGRIANLILATALIAWAIAVVPFGRWTLALLALTPMAVFMRASLAVDALVFAFAIALVAAILAGRAWAAVVLSFLLAAVKPGYLLMPLLAIAVPNLRRRRGAMLSLLVALTAGTITAVTWVRAANLSAQPRVNSRSAAILHHPVAFAGDLTREITRNAALLGTEAVAFFGWLDAPAPGAFIALWAAGLLIVAVLDGRCLMTAAARTLSLLLFAASVGLILTLLHLGTPPDRGFIAGIQGRYFLPLLPLLLLPLASIAAAEAVKARMVQLLVAVGVMQSLWTIVTRYWI
jgi:uncharacterized membrane protein